MKNYNFYYDESEHSRRITLNTINANNYYDNFIVAIVGCEADKQNTVFERYTLFEEKYEERKSDGELKSTAIKQNQMKNGFASLSKENVTLLNDFLEIFDENTLIYFSSISKIEYIINQLFEDYQSDLIIDAEAMKYSIIKAILGYRPKEILEGIYQDTLELINLLKVFFENKIEQNKSNITLKKKENESFSQILVILNDISVIKTIDWDYKFAFIGFLKYLDERGISEYSLVIDKEGDMENTVKAARSVGIDNVSDEDSINSCGVRIADMLVGLISKLSKALHNALSYDSIEEQTQKKMLNKSWFRINEDQFLLYKKLYYVICQLNNAWYKSYAGIYSDDLVVFVSLLQYINHFKTLNEIKDSNIEMLGEYFNAYACEQLTGYFERLSNKLPIDFIKKDSENCFINRKGARIYSNSNKHLLLKFVNGKCICNVLSVGLIEMKIPVVTIREKDKPVCYRLPTQLYEWALNLITFANQGVNIFPARVAFSKQGEKYFADIL